MDRICRRDWLAYVLTTGVTLAPLSGCNIVATTLWMVKGLDTPPEYPGLNGKRIAVVCRPVPTLQYRYPTAARDLAKQVGSLIAKNLPKTQVIDQREVSEWADEKSWDEYIEIGKALHADMVVGMDLDEFDLYQSQGLYQGKATITKLVVYDVKDGRTPVFEKSLPQIHYPPSSPIPSGDKPEPEFRAQFINVLGEHIARFFYRHDPTATFASDSTAL